MSKILVSSKHLAKCLREDASIDQMRVRDLNGTGWGYLELLSQGEHVTELSVAAKSDFDYKFTTDQKAQHLLAALEKMPEQPIALEDFGELQVSHISIFR